eukprot:symbB.v1.2.033430.t2/scaffold4150.1/size43807/2
MRSQSLQVNDLVYVPCGKVKPFIPGIVLEVNDREVVVLADDGRRSCAPSDLRPRFDGDSCQDNTSLVYLNDATILQNLRSRHQEDAIYTYTASVLLAVNPYHNVEGLYSENQCANYRGKHIGALPPHPFAIADAAYRALVREHKNQSFIISGESGAGKTETAKIVMQYLGFVSGSSSNVTAQIQKRILQAQPILESFGNAVTMRNNNSSRFGKYNRIFFDETGTLVDAGVTTYLLESSRVVMHSGLERTYHCFYEMLAGLSEEKLSTWQLTGKHLLLTDIEDVEQTQMKKRIEDIDKQTWHSQFQERDLRNFHRLTEALTVVGFTEGDMDSIFQVLAGLVHLGDLALAERDEGEESSVQLDEETLEKAASLLGMDADGLGSALRRRRVRVVHPGRESVHEVPRTTSQFRHALHSLIKALYKRLFERLVDRINCSFQELQSVHSDQEDCRREIGILDIYGFERLERNSFEQLCINLANERLQQYFIENVLMAEQDLYRREGLGWHGLELPDSTPVVSAIGHTFKILDEYSQQLAKGFEKTSDESFCQKTVDEAQKDPQRREFLRQLRVSKRRPAAVNEGFVVKHYAGLVEYNTKGWLDKNNDRLLPDCEELIGSSSFELVASLTDQDVGKAPFRSISKKYCADLENLLQTLSKCQIHYIRCFKPNDLQQPGIFDEQLVLDQIVQCGTVELVKLMHDGYPNRCQFHEMLRFRDLLPERFQRYGTRTFIEALLLAYDVPSEDWALGMSRVFLRAGQLKALEDLRSAGAAPSPEKLQVIMRSIIRKRWIRAAHSIRLCLYLPKFLAAIRLKRAEEALATRALLVGRLRTSRLRAKRQKARRRWRVVFQVLRLTWSFMEEAKMRRLQKTLRKFGLLRTRLQEWATSRAEEAMEARRRAEEERLEDESKKAEEEARLEEERRRLAEEEARQAESRRAADEALKVCWTVIGLQHLCDVVLISNDGREKHVHRIVLSAASSALKLLLGETFSEGEHIRRGQPIKIAASGDVVGALIDHIYGGEPTVSPADAVELLRLAGAYELPKLVAEIESELRASLDGGMALNLLQQISALNPTELREACEEEIAHDFENCTKDANFARLCAPQLARILARDNLWVTREEVVLQALFKWVQASNERKSYLGMLLQHIDFISFSNKNLAILGSFAQSLGPEGFELQYSVDQALRQRQTIPSFSGRPKRRCLDDWSPELGSFPNTCAYGEWVAGDWPSDVVELDFGPFDEDGHPQLSFSWQQDGVYIAANEKLVRWKLGEREGEVLLKNFKFGRATVSQDGQIFFVNSSKGRLLTVQHGEIQVMREIEDLRFCYCSPRGVLYVVGDTFVPGDGRMGWVQKFVDGNLVPVIDSVNVARPFKFTAYSICVSKNEILYIAGSQYIYDREFILKVDPNSSEPEIVGFAEPDDDCRDDNFHFSGVFVTDSGKVYATDREPEQIVTFNECDTQPVQVLDLSWTTYDEPVDLFVEEECVYVLFSWISPTATYFFCSTQAEDEKDKRSVMHVASPCRSSEWRLELSAVVRFSDGRIAALHAKELMPMTVAMRRGISDLKIAGVDRIDFYDVVEPESYSREEEVSFNIAKANANGWQLEPLGCTPVFSVPLQARHWCSPTGFLGPGSGRRAGGPGLQHWRLRDAGGAYLEAQQSLERLARVAFLHGDFNAPEGDINAALHQATVAYYASYSLADYNMSTGEAVCKMVERAPVLKHMQPGSRFISLSVLSPEFEMWNEVELVGAIQVHSAYSVRKRRSRLALEYRVLGKL